MDEKPHGRVITLSSYYLSLSRFIHGVEHGKSLEISKFGTVDEITYENGKCMFKKELELPKI